MKTESYYDILKWNYNIIVIESQLKRSIHEIQDTVIDILQELNPEVDFDSSQTLIDDGILDSFDLVSLIGELTDAFGVDISFDDIEPENFNSADQIAALVKRLEDED